MHWTLLENTSCLGIHKTDLMHQENMFSALTWMNHPIRAWGPLCNLVTPTHFTEPVVWGCSLPHTAAANLDLGTWKITLQTKRTSTVQGISHCFQVVLLFFSAILKAAHITVFKGNPSLSIACNANLSVHFSKGNAAPWECINTWTSEKMYTVIHQ